MPSVTDYQVERLTPLYGNLPVGELLQRWWDTFGNPVEDPLTNQKLFDRYTLAGAAGASLQDKAYSYWSAGLLGSAVSLPGTAGNYISSPDSVLNSITGDIDIRVKVALTDWNAINQTFVNNRGTNTGFAFRTHSSTPDTLEFAWGTAGGNIFRSVAWTPPADGAVKWLRVTMDVDNGAGQSRREFFQSDDGITWTLIAGDTTSGTTYIADGSLLELGSAGSGTSALLAGTIYYVEIRNGINGPIVAKYDSSSVVVSGTQLPTTIPGWTLNGSALYKRDDYIRLPGTTGNYLSYPDSVTNSVTGDLDIRMKVSLDDWTPASDVDLMGKWTDTGNQKGFLFRSITTGGNPGIRLYISTTGADAIVASSTALSVVDGQAIWVRATRVQSSGLTSFYDSPDGVTWTARGTAIVSAGSAIYDSVANLTVGAAGTSASLWPGNIYYAEVRSGINGTVVASFDARDIPTPWTINGSGWSWAGTSPTVVPNMALQLPGTSGNYVSTPDSAGVSIVGDIDLRIKVALDDWTPSAGVGLIGKMSGVGAYSYTMEMVAGGGIGFIHSVDGTAALQQNSSVLGFVDGSVHWLRVTLNAANGQKTFYHSDDGVTWTLITQSSAGAATSIFDGASVLAIGARPSAFPLGGKVYYAEVRNGIDGPIVARFDPSAISKTATRTPTTIISQGTPNLLTPNQASIETDATGWAANDANTTLARSTAQFLDGVASLAFTSIAAGSTQVRTVGTVPAVPRKSYTVTIWARANTASQTGSAEIRWGAAGDALISSSSSGYSSLSTSAWTAFTVTGIAPPTAQMMSAKFNYQTAVAGGETVYIDRISLTETPVVWTMNGAAWDWVAA